MNKKILKGALSAILKVGAHSSVKNDDKFKETLKALEEILNDDNVQFRNIKEFQTMLDSFRLMPIGGTNININKFLIAYGDTVADMTSTEPSRTKKRIAKEINKMRVRYGG